MPGSEDMCKLSPSLTAGMRRQTRFWKVCRTEGQSCRHPGMKALSWLEIWPWNRGTALKWRNHHRIGCDHGGMVRNINWRGSFNKKNRRCMLWRPKDQTTLATARQSNGLTDRPATQQRAVGSAGDSGLRVETKKDNVGESRAKPSDVSANKLSSEDSSVAGAMRLPQRMNLRRMWGIRRSTQSRIWARWELSPLCTLDHVVWAGQGQDLWMRGGEEQQEALAKWDQGSDNEGDKRGGNWGKKWPEAKETHRMNSRYQSTDSHTHARFILHMSLHWEAGENKGTLWLTRKENLLLALRLEFSCNKGKPK